MEPLPPALPPASSIPATKVAVATTANYADSLDLSPRSRNTDSWDDLAPTPTLHSKLQLMCSYGGMIIPRPHDKVLCYVGGETQMVVVDRQTPLVSIQHHVFKAYLPVFTRDEVMVFIDDGMLQIGTANGKFASRFKLPDNAKTNQIEVFMENGMLIVTVGKEEARRPNNVRVVKITE